MDEARYREVEATYLAAVGVSAEERWITLESTGTRVRVLEVGEGPPLLFVHGGSNSGAGFAPILGHFPQRRCLVIDRPGNGLSERLPKRLTFDEFRELSDNLVADVLTGLELDWADLVCTSLGSYIGLRSIAAHPDRVRRYVSLAYAFGAPVEGFAFMMRLAGIRPLGVLMSRLPAPRRVVIQMLGQLGLEEAIDDGRVIPESIDWFHSVIRDTNTMRNEVDTMPQLIDFRRGLHPEAALGDDVLGAITRPGLFLWGTDDPFGGHDVATAFVQRIPGAELEMLLGMGHAPWLEAPEQIARSIRSFLSAQD